MKTYDLFVLGGGTAGMTVARAAAARGWKVGVAESRFLGGTCVNVGCIPSKTLIYTARLMHMINSADDYGISSGKPEADWGKIIRRKNQVVEEMRSGGYSSVESNDNLILYRGEAAFVGPDRISVDGEQLQAKRILIATGARPNIPPIPGLDKSNYLTSTTAMELEQLPQSLLIIGGGIIAVEFAQMFARFGVKVTILDREDTIANRLEPEISRELQETLESEGVEVLTSIDISEVSGSGPVTVKAKREGEELSLTAERVLVATGRAPNTDSLDLPAAGVETDSRGYVTTDEQFATNAENIWAAGDVTGGAMFTHKAWHDGFILSRHLITGEAISNKDRLIPFAVFTDPEVGGIGLGEEKARQAGHDVKIQSYPYDYGGRARAIGQRRGFVKLVTEKSDGRILGAHIFGAQAGEIIHELVMAMRFEATVNDLQDMMHIHPTLAEAINSAGLST